MNTKFCFLTTKFISLIGKKSPVKVVHADYMLDLPDECLSLVFSSLSQSDRNTCSLVCHRWYRVEAQSRQHLVLHASRSLSIGWQRVLPCKGLKQRHLNMKAFLPGLLTRFENTTKLSVKAGCRFESISYDSLNFISTKLPWLTHLKLQSCFFGPRHLDAILNSCPLLEYLSLKSVYWDISLFELLAKSLPGDPSLDTPSQNLHRVIVKRMLEHETFNGLNPLKSVSLKDSDNLQGIMRYLALCKNLRTIKILRCRGPWDEALDEITSRIPGIIVHRS